MESVGAGSGGDRVKFRLMGDVAEGYAHYTENYGGAGFREPG